MTNPAKHSAGSVTRKSKMRGPALLFTVVAVALASFSAVTWRATTTRITDLEDRIDRLTRTLDQRLPEGGWRAELERAGNEIGVRANESLRREGDRIRANIEARFEVRLQALTASLEAATRPGAERESGTRSAGSPPPVSRSRPARPGPSPGDTGELKAAPTFERGLASLYGTLALTPERREELGNGLEGVLRSVWPLYLAHHRTGGADAGDLRERFCTGVQAVLTPEEAARLGCR